MSCCCGFGADYISCCLPLHTGKIKAESAEQLMRSRYSAFVHMQLDYLKKTSANKQDFSKSKIRLWLKNVTWQKLEIVSVEDLVTEAYVTFKAYYLEFKKPQVMEEKSYFQKINNTWLYIGSK